MSRRWCALLAVLVCVSSSRSAGLAASISGRVLLRQGTPAAGADVAIFYDHDGSGYGSAVLAETRADTRGRFKFEDIQFDVPRVCIHGWRTGRFVLLARDGLGKFGWRTTSFPAGEVATLSLGRTRSIKCTAHDDENIRVPGAVISLAAVFIEDSFPADAGMTVLPWSGGWAISGTTDHKGEVTLKDVPEGSICILAKAPGHPLTAVRVGTGAREVGIRLLPAAHIEGRIRSEHRAGEPGPGMLVHIYGEPWPGIWAVTDEQGAFRLNVPAGDRENVIVLAEDPSPAPIRHPVAHALALKRNEKPAAIVFIMPRGPRISGSVSSAGDGSPISNLTLCIAASVRGCEKPINLYRRSDLDGHYVTALGGGRATVGVIPVAPEGYVFATPPADYTQIAVTAAAPRTNLQVTIAKSASVPVRVRLPNGTPANGARLMVQGLSHRTWSTGPDGTALLEGLPAGCSREVYITAPHQQAAAMETITVPAVPPEAPVEIRLQPAAEGRISLWGEEDNRVPGFVRVWAADDAGRKSLLPISPLLEQAAGKNEVRVPGLLPHKNYAIISYVPGYRPQHKGQFAVLRFDDIAMPPSLDLYFRREQTPQPPPQQPVVVRASLSGEPTQEFKDTVDEDLTWYFLPDSVAAADIKTGEIGEFSAEFFGEKSIKPSCLAFGKDAVWLGTHKGLFVWDRAEKYWYWCSVDLYVDLPVTALSLDEKGHVHVTVQVPGEGRRVYIRDPQANTWTVKH